MLLPALLLVLGLAPARALAPDIERLAERGAEQLYDLEFAAALATFEEVHLAHPSHPAGPALMAAATWWQARYWYKAPDAAASAQVERWLKEAETSARAMIRSPDPDVACEGRFFLGGALGVRAHWQLLRHNWVGSALGAREAVQVLTDLAACPTWGEEAGFGIGLYQYVAASLPAPLRWLSRFVVGHASRKEALAKLERAAVAARWTRNDAQATLALLYDVYDGRPALALAPAERLIRERPHSPMAHQLMAQALLFVGRWSEAVAACDRALAWADRPGSTFALEASSYHELRGMALLGLRRPAEAVAAFTAAIAAHGRAPWVTAATVRRGAAFDLLGERAAALADYRAAQRLPDPWRVAKRAKAYLARPFTWDDFARELTLHGGNGR